MATTLPVTVRENNRIVAKLDDWDDAQIMVQRWSNNRPNFTYTVEMDDSYTRMVLTANNGQTHLQEGLPTRKRKSR